MRLWIGLILGVEERDWVEDPRELISKKGTLDNTDKKMLRDG